MEVKTYTYSKNVVWLNIAYKGIVVIILTTVASLFYKGDQIFWLMVVVMDIIAAILLVIYVAKFLPLANAGAIAMRMDNDKLEYYDDKEIIYWKDVKSINTYSNRGGNGLKFKLNNNNTVTVSTRWLIGNDQDIYEEVCKYYASVTQTIAQP